MWPGVVRYSQVWHAVVTWMGVIAKTEREQVRDRENTPRARKHAVMGRDRRGGSNEWEAARALRLAGGGQLALPFGSCEQIPQTSIFPSVKWAWGVLGKSCKMSGESCTCQAREKDQRDSG